jgi:hypothetical protein
MKLGRQSDEEAGGRAGRPEPLANLDYHTGDSHDGSNGCRDSAWAGALYTGRAKKPSNGQVIRR